MMVNHDALETGGPCECGAWHEKPGPVKPAQIIPVTGGIVVTIAAEIVPYQPPIVVVDRSCLGLTITFTERTWT
jgi:hypothetical protein